MVVCAPRPARFIGIRLRKWPVLFAACAALNECAGIVPSGFRPTHHLRGDARTDKGNADALAVFIESPCKLSLTRRRLFANRQQKSPSGKGRRFSRLVAHLEPHSLSRSTLPGGQVGMGVSPNLNALVLCKLSRHCQLVPRKNLDITISGRNHFALYLCVLPRSLWQQVCQYCNRGKKIFTLGGMREDLLKTIANMRRRL